MENLQISKNISETSASKWEFVPSTRVLEERQPIPNGVLNWRMQMIPRCHENIDYVFCWASANYTRESLDCQWREGSLPLLPRFVESRGVDRCILFQRDRNDTVWTLETRFTLAILDRLNTTQCTNRKQTWMFRRFIEYWMMPETSSGPSELRSESNLLWNCAFCQCYIAVTSRHKIWPILVKLTQVYQLQALKK